MLSRHSSSRGEIHVGTGTSWGERTRRAWLSPEVQSRSWPRAQTPAACVGVLGWLRPMVEQSHPAKSTSSASDLLMKAWIWAQENRVRVAALSLLQEQPSGAPRNPLGAMELWNFTEHMEENRQHQAKRPRGTLPVPAAPQKWWGCDSATQGNTLENVCLGTKRLFGIKSLFAFCTIIVQQGQGRENLPYNWSPGITLQTIKRCTETDLVISHREKCRMCAEFYRFCQT